MSLKLKRATSSSLFHSDEESVTKKAHQLYQAFVASLERCEATKDERVFLQIVQGWLKDNVSAFEPDERRIYALDDFSSLALEELPIEYSDLNAAEEFERLRDASPSSLEGLAARIRDILWAGLVIRSRKRCPRCNEDDLKVLQETSSSQLVYTCDMCGWAQLRDGTEWSCRGEVAPAPTAMLRRHGLLSRGI